MSRWVEASMIGCPDRTLWELRSDGEWHCTCKPGICREICEWADLINPVPVSPSTCTSKETP